MLIVRSETTAAARRHGEFEKWWAEQGEFLKTQRGFLGGILLNSLGQLSKYSGIFRWESREAARAYFRRAPSEGEPVPPQGLATPVRPLAVYELVVEVVNEGRQATYLAFVDWTIKPGQAAAFESSRQELFELRRRHIGGFVSNRLYRYLGNPRQYVTVLAYATLEALQSGGAAPEIREWDRSHPVSLYTDTPSLAERYEVVQRVEA